MLVEDMMWARSFSGEGRKISKSGIGVKGSKGRTSSKIVNCCADVDLVLPFEFSPHASELWLE